MLKQYKPAILRQVKESLRSFIRDPGQILANKEKKQCPCCGYHGPFISMRNNLPEYRCPNCASRPRDRLLAHAMERMNVDIERGNVLHFSPEPNLYRRLKDNPNYISGDIKQSKYAKYEVNITSISYPDAFFDIIICNHILEHVADHHQGLRECFRVLKPGGWAFFSVPYRQDLEKTWYPPEGMSTAEIERICGWDHKRLYGRDFPDILSTPGFKVQTYMMEPDEINLYRILDYDPIFIATK